MIWFIENWEYCLIAFYTLEKVVKVTPCKWDDIIVAGLAATIIDWKCWITIKRLDI